MCILNSVLIHMYKDDISIFLFLVSFKTLDDATIPLQLCITLQCIALHCIALYCIALHCIALYCIALHCIALHCMVIAIAIA